MPITERDQALLAFAAQHRFVIAPQLAVLLEVTIAVAEERVRALTAGGYLRASEPLNGQPALAQVTRAGLKAIGSDLPVPRKPDLSLYAHDQGLAWLMLAAHRGRFGPVREVVSERRMRSADGRLPAEGDWRSQHHGVRLDGLGPGGRERLHYPDLVLVTAAGHRVAFELELSTKDRNRRERILAAYAADRRIDAVVYLVDRPSVGAAIARSAARLGISDLVRVQNVDVGRGEQAAEGGRGARRSHQRQAASARGRAPARQLGAGR